MEYLADNILEIANIIGGVPAMDAILKELEKGVNKNEIN